MSPRVMASGGDCVLRLAIPIASLRPFGLPRQRPNGDPTSSERDGPPPENAADYVGQASRRYNHPSSLTLFLVNRARAGTSMARRWGTLVGGNRKPGPRLVFGARRLPFPALAAMSAFSDFAPSFETPAASSDRSAFPGEREPSGGCIRQLPIGVNLGVSIRIAVSG